MYLRPIPLLGVQMCARLRLVGGDIGCSWIDRQVVPERRRHAGPTFDLNCRLSKALLGHPFRWLLALFQLLGNTIRRCRKSYVHLP